MTTTYKVYNYNHEGMYTGMSEADESPLEPGIPMVPAHSTLLPPPERTPMTWPKFDAGGWMLVPIEEKDTIKLPLASMYGDELVSAAHLDIDGMATIARARVIGSESLRAEHLLAEAAARAHVAGTDTESPFVLDWADAKGISPDEAAAQIISAAELTNAKIARIRGLRIKAKEAIRQLAANDATAQEMQAEAIRFCNEINACTAYTPPQAEYPEIPVIPPEVKWARGEDGEIIQ